MTMVLRATVGQKRLSRTNCLIRRLSLSQLVNIPLTKMKRLVGVTMTHLDRHRHIGERQLELVVAARYKKFNHES